MSWVKLDDGFFRNRKSVAAGKDGRAMFLASLCFCAQGLTDGDIASEAVRIIAADAEVSAKTADKLVAVGYWVVTEGGYNIPDYLSYNPSRRQVLDERERAASRQRSHRDSRRDDDRSNGVSSDAPVPSRPPGETFSPSSPPSSDPSDDEAVLEQALVAYVDRKLAQANGRIDDPVPWKRKVLANARVELIPQAREWITRYDVTPNQLADALVAGAVPPSWNNCRRPA